MDVGLSFGPIPHVLIERLHWSRWRFKSEEQDQNEQRISNCSLSKDGVDTHTMYSSGSIDSQYRLHVHRCTAILSLDSAPNQCPRASDLSAIMACVWAMNSDSDIFPVYSPPQHQAAYGDDNLGCAHTCSTFVDQYDCMCMPSPDRIQLRAVNSASLQYSRSSLQGIKLKQRSRMVAQHRHGGHRLSCIQASLGHETWVFLRFRKIIVGWIYCGSRAR